MLEKLNNLKIKLFGMLPEWFKNLKYAEYILHAIFGTVIFLLASIFIGYGNAFALVFVIGMGVEILSEMRKIGTGNFFDAIATFIIPLLIFIISIL